MKILMVNKFFYIKGGSETYYFALKGLLEAKGHEVIDFSMKDNKNFESPYSKYFVDEVNYNGQMGLRDKLRAAKNIIYSREAKIKLEKLILETKPDIAHLHIFQHQLSPSILDVLRKYKIPTVYTAHDLKMLCSNYVMMTHGTICEKCKGGNYIHCFKNKCVKDSTLKSGINMIEGYVHKWRKSYDTIDVIITPSNFYRKKFIEFGVGKDKVIHLTNFLDKEEPQVNKLPKVSHLPWKDNYFLYFGRLSAEKGVLSLVKAMEGLEETLYIVGTGPYKEEVEEYISKRDIQNVKVLGFKSGQELTDLVGNAKAVVLPSEWYENGPYSAIEALQLGRPIIGSELGGIPELVDGNGVIFHHKDVDGLKDALQNFSGTNTEKYEAYCKKSKEIFQSKYMSGKHYEQLFSIYNNLLRRKVDEKNT